MPMHTGAGCVESAGIGSLRVTANPGGLEVDHLQYGFGLQSIPTLSEWAILAMVATLLLAGTTMILRRERGSLPQGTSIG